MTTVTVVDKFSAGRVISRTFGAFFAHAPLAFFMSAVFVAGPAMGLAWVQASVPKEPAYGLLLSLVGIVVRTALGAPAQTVIIYGAINHLRRREASIAETWLDGTRHWLPVWLVSLSVTLMTTVALIALVVPGLILITRWCAAVPAQVCEGTGVLAAMKRSAALTKGRRWEVFGLLVLVVVIMLLLELVLAVVLAKPGASVFASMKDPLFQLIVGPLLALVATPITVSGTACLYEELRLAAYDVGLEACEG